MSPRRRLLLLLTTLTVLAVPAVVLRAACVGKSCPASPPAARPPAFCGLPEENRALIAAGFRDTRSPDVLAFGQVVAEVDGGIVTWSMDPDVTEVPLVFLGPAARARELPPGVVLDRVAPTLAESAGLRRPHPEDRSGTPVPGVLRPGDPPPLLVIVVWKGVGTAELTRDRTAWPGLRALARDGASTMQARTGSVPVDPAAVLSTIGSGALPSQHGVTGSLLRAADGGVAPAWRSAPLPVIAFLGDDLDERTDQRSRIGLVAAAPSDRGLIGGTWYLGHDRDDVVLRRPPLEALADLLDSGYGAADGTVDLVGVTLHGPIRSMDHATSAIVRLVRQRVPDATLAITATGDAGRTSDGVPVDALVTEMEQEIAVVDVVAAAGSAGLFLDPVRAGVGKVSDPVAAQALERAGARLGADIVSFPGYSVTLRRFC